MTDLTVNLHSDPDLIRLAEGTRLRSKVAISDNDADGLERTTPLALSGVLSAPQAQMVR